MRIAGRFQDDGARPRRDRVMKGSGLFLGCAFLFFAGILFGQQDILLITLDTTRADHLSCYGYSLKTSPSLDEFVKGAVRFTQAYTPVPYTLPSHSTMMTGLWPKDHGVRDNVVAPLRSDVPTVASLLQARGYRTAAFVSSFVLDRRFGLARGFGLYDDAMTVVSREREEQNERSAPETEKRVTDYLAGLPAGGRVFVWVHFYDPHTPYHEHSDTPLGMGDYDGEIRFMDRSVGRVIQAWTARRKGLILIAADHGESLGDHGESHHGVFLYNACVRSVLMFRAEGRTTPGTDGRLACLTDVAATLLDFAGVPAPPMPGRSLLSPGPLHDRIFFESFVSANNWGWTPPFGILKDGYKYIHLPRPELYHLTDDPDEEDNLADVLRPKCRELRDLLKSGYGMTYVPAEGVPGGETVKRLEALGYRGGSTAHADKDPKDLVWLVDEMDRGRGLEREADYGEAEKAYRGILRINPENSPIRIDLFVMLRRLGRRQEARGVLTAGLDLNSRDVYVHYNLGVLDFEEDHLDAALKHFNAVLLLSPEQQDALFYRFWIALKKGDAVTARKYLDRAEHVDPSNPNIEFFRGLMAAHLGDLRAAVGHFRACLQSRPDHQDALNSLGQAYFLMQRFEESAESYRKSLAVNPDQPKTYLHLGAILLNSIKDAPGALHYFQMFLARYPQDSEAPGVREVVEELSAQHP